MAYPTPIRVISDLHLGHPACRINEVANLRPLFEGVRTVIFNGDTVELRSRKLRVKSERYLAELTSLLDDMQVESVFLRGNHDPQISDREFVKLEAEGILTIHGDCLYHNISPWNSKLWELEPVYQRIYDSFPEQELQSSLSTWLDYIHQCRLESYGNEERPFADSFRQLRAALSLVFPPRRPIEIVRCWLEMGSRIERFQRSYMPGLNYIIVGHTHRPGIMHLNDGQLIGINTGGFLSIGKAWIVDIDKESLVVRKVKERGVEMDISRIVYRNQL